MGQTSATASKMNKIAGPYANIDTEDKQQLLQAFKTFDKNGDGYITADELSEVLKSQNARVGDSEIDAIMADADTDGDGKISYLEFVKVITGETKR